MTVPKVDLAWPASCDCEALRAEVAELRELLSALLQQAYEYGREDERNGKEERRSRFRVIKGGRLVSLAATAGAAAVAYSAVILPVLNDRAGILL